jgi:hypothetical protein
VDNGSTSTTFTTDAVTSAGKGAYIFRANNISLPASGSYKVTVTTSALSTIQVKAIEFAGLRSGPPSATNTGSGTGTAVTDSVTSTGSAVFFGGFSDSSSQNPQSITFNSAGAGFVQDFVNTNGSSYWPAAEASAIVSGAATESTSWTIGSSSAWGAVIAAYPAAAALAGDTTPPDTTITSGPPNPSTDSSASFSFTGTDNVTASASLTYECKLDAQAFAACTSPQPYSALTDGSHTFQVRAKDAAGNVDPTPASQTWQIGTGDAVMLGAGDIAGCDSNGDEQTATLIGGLAGAVFTLGDNAYPNGLLSDFTSCYAPSWGRSQIKSRTRPVAGNHDYGDGSNNGNGYFDYFNGAGNFTGPAGDRDKGYYSYDVGAYWHVVALNSECGIDASCSASSEESWLRSDLAANASKNVIAMWHRPRWGRPGNAGLQPLWQDLYAYGVELLLCGHDHDYERFAPQNALGQRDDAHGVREIVVGTGGETLDAVGGPLPNTQALNNTTWGVVKLTLHRSSFDWQFVPVAGGSFTDSGTDQVHSGP